MFIFSFRSEYGLRLDYNIRTNAITATHKKIKFSTQLAGAFFEYQYRAIKMQPTLEFSFKILQE